MYIYGSLGKSRAESAAVEGYEANGNRGTWSVQRMHDRRHWVPGTRWWKWVSQLTAGDGSADSFRATIIERLFS